MRLPTNAMVTHIDPVQPLGKKIEKSKPEPKTIQPVPGKPGLFETPEGKLIYDPAQSKTPPKPAALAHLEMPTVVTDADKRNNTTVQSDWILPRDMKPPKEGWYRAKYDRYYVLDAFRYWHGEYWSAVVGQKARMTPDDPAKHRTATYASDEYWWRDLCATD